MIEALILPLVAQRDITFSPPPTHRVARVYRYLGLDVDEADPVVDVFVDTPPTGVKPTPGQHVVGIWFVLERANGSAQVVLSPQATRRQIAWALAEAMD